MIALEPEAAAISCLEKNTSEFQSETGCSSVEGLLSQPNTHYMVVDIGGNSFLFLFALRICQGTMEHTKFMFLTNQLPKFCAGGENVDTKLQILQLPKTFRVDVYQNMHYIQSCKSS